VRLHVDIRPTLTERCRSRISAADRHLGTIDKHRRSAVANRSPDGERLGGTEGYRGSSVGATSAVGTRGNDCPSSHGQSNRCQDGPKNDAVACSVELSLVVAAPQEEAQESGPTHHNHHDALPTANKAATGTIRSRLRRLARSRLHLVTRSSVLTSPVRRSQSTGLAAMRASFPGGYSDRGSDDVYPECAGLPRSITDSVPALWRIHQSGFPFTVGDEVERFARRPGRDIWHMPSTDSDLTEATMWFRNEWSARRSRLPAEQQGLPREQLPAT
jgi:hypothetical protein